MGFGYTEEQKQWLMEHAQMGKFRSKGGGRMKAQRIRNAFESRFGQTRSPQALSQKVRVLQYGEYPSRTRWKESRKRSGNQNTGNVTLGQIESRIERLLANIEKIRGLIGE